MAKVIAIGEPVNDSEREAIGYLRDNLPDGYVLVHNFEVTNQVEVFEIDLAVLAPHAVYLVDIKGTRGVIDVHGPKWYPEGRQPFTSPLIKLRNHARILKGIIKDSQPGRKELKDIYVDAVVILTSQDAVIIDPVGKDALNVTSLKKSGEFFQDATRVPDHFFRNIAILHGQVIKAIQGIARPRSGPLRWGSWEVIERLGGDDRYTEYRAFNFYVGKRSATVLLRVYQADPYAPQADREEQKAFIANAYKALTKLPGHPNVMGVKDFFPTEGENYYILVTDDVPGQALRVHISRPQLALTVDQKLHMTQDLLRALAHIHAHQVVHRNLSPDSLLLGMDGRIHLTDFDYARSGMDRSRTIGPEIVDKLEYKYAAPELHGEPSAATPASDIFSAGLILYELFTGEKPFSSATEVFDQSGVFPTKPSELISTLPAGLDEWLQRICTFEPEQRQSAEDALSDLLRLLQPPTSSESEREEKPTNKATEKPEPPDKETVDYGNLTSGELLTPKYLVEKRLGRPGSFGVVYKVIDTLGDVARAVKVILRDRYSTLDRLKKEYQTLLRTPDHPHVVKVIDADLIPGGPPFIVFDYVDGLDVGEMIESCLFNPDDALELARQVAGGLVHLHRHGVYHCDIKPRNLLWTDQGVKIIDFNVAVIAGCEEGIGGGSRRYLPPDLDLSAEPQPVDLMDRDLYALGLTLYETVTGSYPWETATPPPGRAAPDPRELSSLADLSPDFVKVMLKSTAPYRSERFASAIEFQNSLSHVSRAKRISLKSTVPSLIMLPGMGPDGHPPANSNPYVSYLLTLYSQSRRSNAGTRGLDALGDQLYVETALDRELAPAILNGEFCLVIISGNAGDGKTAFLQRLESEARKRGANFDYAHSNGFGFTLGNRVFMSNYDGSQDEGNQSNDDVLRAFLQPFAGDSVATWPQNEVRLIAINEGRLVDFLTSEEQLFPQLAQLVRQGLTTGMPTGGLAVINLNLRSVLAACGNEPDSIFERLIRRMTDHALWHFCLSCDLKDRCYVHHNVRTFQDEIAGPRVIERLKWLFTVTHLRARRHMTLRDVRSALSFMLVGTRDCKEIHEIYVAGNRAVIVQGFYFNSWQGGDANTADLLLTLLKDADVGRATDSRTDRLLDFVSPRDHHGMFRFEARGNYDREVLLRLFGDLPRDASAQTNSQRQEIHRRFLSMARRRVFFERRDSTWKSMVPFAYAERMLSLVNGNGETERVLPEVLSAINRSEGFVTPERLGNSLALRVRTLEKGTIRSYRLFPGERFSLSVLDEGARARFMEHMPSSLVLRYQGETQSDADLVINLDVFEMLGRLNQGYVPSVEEQQGHYLGLSVFKNMLGSAPYQEVLLTTTGRDFYAMKRHGDGRLEMNRIDPGDR